MHVHTIKHTTYTAHTCTLCVYTNQIVRLDIDYCEQCNILVRIECDSIPNTSNVLDSVLVPRTTHYSIHAEWVINSLSLRHKCATVPMRSIQLSSNNKPKKQHFSWAFVSANRFHHLACDKYTEHPKVLCAAIFTKQICGLTT